MGGVERVREKDVVNVPKMKVPRTEPSVEEQPKVRVKRSPLGEFNNLENLLNNGRPVYGTGRAFGKDGLFQVPTVVPTTRNNYHINNEMAFTATNPTNGREFNRFGAEPDASGVQPSNITSAIRSQMVSSLNDQPGQRAGTSKELYELKRKVAGNFLIGNANGKGIPNSQRMMDLVGAAAGGKDREVKVGGDRRRRLGTEGNQVLIMEDREAEERKTRLKGKDTKNGGKKKETRPGYCENCREKFDDFDDVCLLNSFIVVDSLLTLCLIALILTTPQAICRR
jgi:regulatory subunit for Cdc7p protein kinase